ncbi:hypothetical protein CC2G_002717 [Coprinopsis cinerea AmutBmut pab1-1]|nr:hypothetical protein CC2G_002717 [Coprinopsis cinerea AmutBmut pab1-1]
MTPHIPALAITSPHPTFPHLRNIHPTPAHADSPHVSALWMSASASPQPASTSGPTRPATEGGADRAEKPRNRPLGAQTLHVTSYTSL